MNEKSFLERTGSFFWVLVGLWFLVLFAQTHEAHLLADGLTYGALAKNILKTGDWLTLHYDQVMYPNFYQHPPLAIWLQAWVYQWFGVSEATSRYLPSFLVFLSSVFLLATVRRKEGESALFWTGVVLVTSTRLVKWGSNFYLDGIMGAFGLIAFCFSIFRIGKSNSFLSGVFLSFALMTKGVAALSLVGGVFVITLLSEKHLGERFSERLKRLAWLLVGTTLPIAVWIAFFKGGEYIRLYLESSVVSRVQTRELLSGPWVNLKSTFLPWFWLLIPAGVYALWKAIYTRLQSALGLWTFMLAISFPIGFSFGAIFLEHYLTPFYLFACVPIGLLVSRVVRVGRKTQKGLSSVFVFANLFIATLAPSVHEMKDVPVRLWWRELKTLPKERTSSIERVYFSREAADLWQVLAEWTFHTDYDARGDFDPRKAPEAQKSILITTQQENVHPLWVPVPCLFVQGQKAFSTRDLLDLCQ